MPGRDPFPPVPRLPSDSGSGFILLAVIAALLLANYTWGWWAALLLLMAVVVLLAALSSVAERRRWRKRGLLDDPALRDVRKWYRREDFDPILIELVTGEKVLMALPVTRRDPSASGVLALTDRRLLFRPSGRRAHTIWFRHEQITGVAVDERAAGTDVHVSAEGSEFVFKIIASRERAWEVAGHLLAHMDAVTDVARVASAELKAPVFDAEDVATTADDPRIDTYLSVSRQAAREILKRGGSLYLWQEDFGADLALDKLGTRPPHEPVDFESIEAEGVTIEVDARVAFPRHIGVEIARFPRRHFVVTVDGARWGRRGVYAE